jgi:hypothetical protein
MGKKQKLSKRNSNKSLSVGSSFEEDVSASMSVDQKNDQLAIAGEELQ